jgi:uncharacterized membrane protein
MDWTSPTRRDNELFRSNFSVNGSSAAQGTTFRFAMFTSPARAKRGRDMIKTYGIAYAGTLISFLLIDAIWLGVVAKNIYRDQLGELMLPSPNLAVAATFYLFFAMAIVALAVRPGLDAGAIWSAIGYGAVLGLAAYGTYDMTNLSTLKGWPVSLSIIDLAWGTVLTSAASASGYAAVRYFG